MARRNTDFYVVVSVAYRRDRHVETGNVAVEHVCPRLVFQLRIWSRRSDMDMERTYHTVIPPLQSFELCGIVFAE